MQLNRILISFGAEEVRLKNLADNKELTTAQLKDILESLEKLAKLSESVRRHGGDFENFSEQRDQENGKLPAYLVKVRDGNDETVHYFHDEREVRKFHEDNLDLNLFDAEMGQELLPLVSGPAKTNGESPAREAGGVTRGDHDSETDRRTGPQRTEGRSLRRERTGRFSN